MRRTLRIATTLSAFLLAAAPLAAQAPPENAPAGAAPTAQESPTEEQGRKIVIQHFRPQDQRGLNIFETPKEPGVEYTGFKLDFGAAFTSQVQALEHENTGDAGRGERRQHQPARRYRLRLQQLDRERLPPRAAG